MPNSASSEHGEERQAWLNTNRFYLADTGDSEDAFLICGECISKLDDPNPSMYDELPPTPDHAPDSAVRECLQCERLERELQQEAADV
jgi:hypothetical protein